MSRRLLVLSFASLLACGEIKQAPSGTDTTPEDPDDAKTEPGPDPSTKDDETEEGDGQKEGTLVDVLVKDRSRLGARSPNSFRPWRTGLAVSGDRVYWVESGTAPGLYSAPVDCKSSTCVEKLAALTRPSAFAATAKSLLIADTSQLQRWSFSAGKFEKIATATNDIVNLVSDGSNVFWTATDAKGNGEADIQRTTADGTTSSPIGSNGTPIAMGLVGTKVHWAGVEMSGLNGAIQCVGTDGTGAREVSRFSTGFDVMRGNATYLYYASASPPTVHRFTLSTARDEIVADDGSRVADFAVDDTYAYWVERGSPDESGGQLRRVAHDSKKAETLAVAMAYPVALAVSGTTVFVAAAGHSSKQFADGQILKVTVPK